MEKQILEVENTAEIRVEEEEVEDKTGVNLLKHYLTYKLQKWTNKVGRSVVRDPSLFLLLVLTFPGNCISFLLLSLACSLSNFSYS